MINEIDYISINRILDDLQDDPMMSSLTLEQAVRHTLRFNALHGYNKLYQDKQEVVPIHEFRGMLPCDLIRIIQVRDMRSGVCLRGMTDSFTPGMREGRKGETFPHTPHWPGPQWAGELSFKTQGRVIFTSFPEGEVDIAYKAIPVDENGFPMLIDNEVYLGALEAYIRVRMFTSKFNQGKISAGVLQNAQTEYAALSRELLSEFTLPSYSEAEAMSRQLTHLLPRVREFDKGFRFLGDREYLRNHRGGES